MTLGATPYERASALAARMLATTCGAASPASRSSSSVVSSIALVNAVLEEGAVAQDAVDDPEVARAGNVQAEADGAGALDDLGLLDHRLGGGVGLVVDAGDLGVVVDLRLGRAVRVERAVPVEVVVGDVQAGGRERRELAARDCG